MPEQGRGRARAPNFCVDYVQSTRDNAGDTILYLLFARREGPLPLTGDGRRAARSVRLPMAADERPGSATTPSARSAAVGAYGLAWPDGAPSRARGLGQPEPA